MLSIADFVEYADDNTKCRVPGDFISPKRSKAKTWPKFGTDASSLLMVGTGTFPVDFNSHFTIFIQPIWFTNLKNNRGKMHVKQE